MEEKTFMPWSIALRSKQQGREVLGYILVFQTETGAKNPGTWGFLLLYSSHASVKQLSQ